MRILIPLVFLCACGITYTEEPKAQFSYPNYLITADAFVGFHEKTNRAELKQFMNIDPTRYEWCAAFVNATLYVNKVPGSESVSEHPLMARSFLTWGEGVEEPRLGDIVIFPRGNAGWQGHVGFYIRTVKRDNIDYYVILGGNQDNAVSYELYPASKALGVRRWDTNQ